MRLNDLLLAAIVLRIIDVCFLQARGTAQVLQNEFQETCDGLVRDGRGPEFPHAGYAFYPTWSFPLKRQVFEQATILGDGLTLSTCIPALANNAKANLPRLLSSMQNATVAADEAVVVVSNVNMTDQRDGDQFCQDIHEFCRQHYSRAPLTTMCIGERLTAGRARNVAAQVSRGRLLSFMDSDDAEYTIRNEVVKNLFECNQPGLKLVLHSLAKAYEQPHRYERKRGYARGVAPHAIPPGLACADQEKNVPVWRGERLYDQLAETHTQLWLKADIAHGHMVVDRSVFQHVRFTTLAHGEDSLFLRDLMYEYGRNESAYLYISRPLSFYDSRGRSHADLK